MHLVLLFAVGVFTVSAQDKKAAAPAAAAETDETKMLLLESPAGTSTPEKPAVIFGVWDFIRMILVLAFVVALIYGVFHLLKKISAPKDGRLGFIQVLETRNLAANRNLHLVEVGGQILLVGSSEGGVTLVTEISDKETIDGIRLKVSETGSESPGKNFADLVKGFLGRKSGDVPPDESLEFIKRQRERLKKLS